MRYESMLGATYGRLKVTGFFERGGRVHCRCLCSCGQETSARASHMLRGRPSSCGCLQRERARQTQYKHGLSKTTRAYSSWSAAVRRCTDPKDPNWADYGGRGIRICKEWEDFTCFYSDMGERPRGFSLERKDVNGPYSPANCVWIPYRDQVLNTRRTVWIEFLGERLTLMQWAQRFGVSRTMLYHRYRTRPTERVFEGLVQHGSRDQ